MIDLAGQRLAGRYTLASLIGHGGMADVYRGIDTTLEREVAVKVLTDRSAATATSFLHEAQAMARFNHRNIVAVYDAGRDGDVAYIVMELLTGTTLADIAPSTLTIHTAIRYVIDVLEALAYAHERDVIHRDVKPANIMICSDGTVKVMDFGLSRRTSEHSTETSAGAIVGTIAYLAPERFLGQAVDLRSDLYSLGVVMYELFTGVVPFRSASDDLVAVIFAHVNDAPAPMRTHNRAVPPPVERIVAKLLAKDPAERYGSARELAGELRSLIGLGSPASVDVRPPGGGRLAGSRELMARRRGPAPAGTEELRTALDRSFRSARTHDAGAANALAGMLAARKGDYSEAQRTYLLALSIFKESGDSVEHAKTAIKFAAMILQKSTESERPVRREIDDAIDILSSALVTARSRSMTKEFDEGERVLTALGRLGQRLR